MGLSRLSSEDLSTEEMEFEVGIKFLLITSKHLLLPLLYQWLIIHPSRNEKDLSPKQKWHIIIFGADTQEGRRFDIWLLWAILFSVLTLMADSVPSIHVKYALQLKYLEYFFTGVFTAEYLARLMVSENTKSYAFSFGES